MTVDVNIVIFIVIVLGVNGAKIVLKRISTVSFLCAFIVIDVILCYSLILRTMYLKLSLLV